MSMQKQTNHLQGGRGKGQGHHVGQKETETAEKEAEGQRTQRQGSQRVKVRGERETGTFLFLITDSGSLCTLPSVKPETLTFLKELLDRQRQTERQADRRTGRWARRN